MSKCEFGYYWCSVLNIKLQDYKLSYGSIISRDFFFSYQYKELQAHLLASERLSQTTHVPGDLQTPVRASQPPVP